MKDKIVEILKKKVARRDAQEKFHGVGRVSHTLQIPLHVDEAKWLIAHLYSAGEEVRDIVCDAMDGFAEAVMRGGEINVSDHVDALTKKLTRPTISEDEIRKALSKYEDVITEFLTGMDVDAGEANNAREEFIKELNR